jgi:hypothetical protein
MSEPTKSGDPHDPTSADDVRQHTQADTEGGDVSEQGDDVPREHTEEPAEG